MTPEGTAAVEAIGKENRRVTMNEIAAHLDMSHGSAHHIVRDVLQFIYIFKVFFLTHRRICQDGLRKKPLKYFRILDDPVRIPSDFKSEGYRHVKMPSARHWFRERVSVRGRGSRGLHP